MKLNLFNTIYPSFFIASDQKSCTYNLTTVIIHRKKYRAVKEYIFMCTYVHSITLLLTTPGCNFEVKN